MRYLSPFRYPGGKAKVAPFIRELVKINGLLDGVYVEPYVGGGAVALSLLMGEYVSEIYINDKDRSIFSVWYCILKDTERFCDLISSTPVNMESWYNAKNVQQDSNNQDYLSLGFATFFLNRTNRSGIIKGGVIGGKNQNGKYKIDARFNKNEMIRRILDISKYSRRIHLDNLDAIEFLDKYKKVFPEQTLIYLDPPYFVKGEDLYLNYYDIKDHKKIAAYLKKIKTFRWIVSYDNHDFISDLYKNFRQNEFELTYSAGSPTKGSEIMIYSNNIKIPSSNIVH